MRLHEAQRTVVKDKHRFRVLLAGRRFGKTILAIEEMLFKAVTTDKARIAYIAPTYQAARDIAWAQLKDRVKELNADINESRLEITLPTANGEKSTIFLRSWDNVETLRGQYFNFLVLDEVAMFRDFNVYWEEVLSPTLTDKKGGCLFISTPKGFNHFYDLYNRQNNQEKYPDWISFHYTSYDNPFIPHEELERERASKPEDAFAQEYLADFRKQEGLVYKEFNRDRHVFKDVEVIPSSITETIVGLDFGYTNPCAVLTIKKDFDGTYWVVDEWYKTGQTDAQIAEYAESIAGNKYYPDPENPGGIKELSDKGLNVIEVVKGKGSVEQGIDRVRQLFKTNKIRILANCTSLINELESYRYEEKKPDKNEPEKPVKENDHAVDALRYAVVMNDTHQAQRMRQAQSRMIHTRLKNQRNIAE